ncbi:MAG: rhomboid family intramembrane serine protease, partial [Chlamydiae bacterium]|nr:rhomboid family intramembrane serine protease [Chlamydiota bacterium]
MRYSFSGKHSSDRLKPLKILILINIGLSLFCALFDSLFPYLNMPRPQIFLSLSLWGVKHLFLWQFLTHFFISPLSQGFNISFVLYIVFNMYFLWMVGSSVIAQKGVKHFLTLYLGGGVLGGVVAASILVSTGSPMLIAGLNPAFYALLTAWMMLFPEMQVLLFFTIPVKIKWLILGILGVNLFMDLSNGDLLHFLPYLASVVFGYLYALLIWRTHGPFPKLHTFEKSL